MCPLRIARRRCVFPAPFSPVISVNGGNSVSGNPTRDRWGLTNERSMVACSYLKTNQEPKKTSVVSCKYPRYDTRDACGFLGASFCSASCQGFVLGFESQSKT